MEQVEVVFAELHSPLFMGGKNHQMKLHKKNGLHLVYDPGMSRLIVKWVDSGKRTHIAWVPLTNVASMSPHDGIDEGAKPEMKNITHHSTLVREPSAAGLSPTPTEAARVQEIVPTRGPGRPPKVTAQVSSPQQHVFEGPGKGRTGIIDKL